MLRVNSNNFKETSYCDRRPESLLYLVTKNVKTIIKVLKKIKPIEKIANGEESHINTRVIANAHLLLKIRRKSCEK